MVKHERGFSRNNEFLFGVFVLFLIKQILFLFPYFSTEEIKSLIPISGCRRYKEYTQTKRLFQRCFFFLVIHKHFKNYVRVGNAKCGIS